MSVRLTEVQPEKKKKHFFGVIILKVGIQRGRLHPSAPSRLGASPAQELGVGRALLCVGLCPSQPRRDGAPPAHGRSGRARGQR